MRDLTQLVNQAKSLPTQGAAVEAFGLIVREFQGMACGYAYSILGDFQLAEDAAQEAFVVAFKQLGELRQPEAFAGWFRRIVWSTCRRSTRLHQVATTPLDAVVELPSREDQPGEIVQKAETHAAVLQAINALPPPEREATTLFYMNEYSQQEIADFLEISVDTVKNRLSASRRRLKERMFDMVKDTMQENAPDERFNQTLMDTLRALETRPIVEMMLPGVLQKPGFVEALRRYAHQTPGPLGLAVQAIVDGLARKLSFDTAVRTARPALPAVVQELLILGAHRGMLDYVLQDMVKAYAAVDTDDGVTALLTTLLEQWRNKPPIS